MRENELRINKKNYEIVKELSDKDLGILAKALCEYQFSGKVNEPKDKVLKVYFSMFKEKIDKLNFYRQTGKAGGIRSTQERQKNSESISLMLDMFKVNTLGEVLEELMKDLSTNEEQKKN